MKVLVFGAGASINAGYPSAKHLMQTIEEDATDHPEETLAKAWKSWVSVRDKAEVQRLHRMLNHENPEIVLSLLDLYAEALGPSDLYQPKSLSRLAVDLLVLANPRFLSANR